MKQKRKGDLFIGTSNVVMPGTKETFPEEFRCKSRLCYYSSLLNSVEVNSSFKKIPQPSTFEKWSTEVNEEFLFTIKMWKEVTHIKKLVIDLDNIDKFLSAAERTGNKKGCLLLQFPGSITIEYFSEVEQILERVHQVNESKWRVAVEFRHESWYSGEGFELLDEYDASMVMHDMKKVKNWKVNKNADFIYYRFHGPKGDYRGDYEIDFLKEISKQIHTYRSSGKHVFVYFNNTMGNAFLNAVSLQEMSK